MRQPIFAAPHLIALLLITVCALLPNPASASSSAVLEYSQAYDAFVGNDANLSAEKLSQVLSDRDIPQDLRAASLFNRSLCYDKLGRTDEAIRDLDALLDLRPGDARALNNRGVYRIVRGQYALAIKDFDAAIARDAGNPRLFFNRAVAYFRLGNYEQAAEDNSGALKLNPNLAPAYANRGIALNALGRQPLAIEDFNQALRLAPGMSLAHYGRGNAQAASGKTDLAIKDFQDAIAKAPNEPEAYNRLAWLLATCPDKRYQNGEQALKYAERAVALRRVGFTLDTQAAALARVGRTKEAAQVQEQAIALIKGDPAFAPLLLGQFQERLDVYRSGRPYTE